jgi:GTP:adenosylcobinamide-phosphate guanylyltransferase
MSVEGRILKRESGNGYVRDLLTLANTIHKRAFLVISAGVADVSYAAIVWSESLSIFNKSGVQLGTYVPSGHLEVQEGDLQRPRERVRIVVSVWMLEECIRRGLRGQV